MRLAVLLVIFFTIIQISAVNVPEKKQKKIIEKQKRTTVYKKQIFIVGKKYKLKIKKEDLK
jgi:hypothetical protein